MTNLTKEEVEKIHSVFPDAIFTVHFNTSASSSWGGGTYTYKDVNKVFENYPPMEFETRDWGASGGSGGSGKFAVIKKFPCVNVCVLSLTNEGEK